MLISRSSCWNWLSRSGKVLKRVFVSKRQKKEPEKSRPPALSCWYWSPVAISAGFQLFCIYSRSERESSDPSSPALTMTKSSLSTVCWTSRALARFPLACTHPKLKPPHLWMMGAALMWKTQQKVKVYVIFLYKLHPLPHHHLLFFCTQQHVKCQNKTCCILSAGTDFCFLWRHTAGPRPRLTFSAPALEPSQSQLWDWYLQLAVKLIPIL